MSQLKQFFEYFSGLAHQKHVALDPAISGNKPYFYSLSPNHVAMNNLVFLFFFLPLLTACDNMSNTTASHKAADNKAGAQRFYDQVMNAHNVNMIDSFCIADFVDHNPIEGHSGKGIADLKSQFTELFAAFPDLLEKPNFMIAEGDTVVVHYTLTGTNTGPMGPMPATNKKISVDGIDILVIHDGKATERWGFFDAAKFMADLSMGGSLDPAEDTSSNGQ